MDALPDLEVSQTPDLGRRWIEAGNEWLGERQRRGKYTGTNGDQVLRFVRKWAAVAPHGPERTTEADLALLLGASGEMKAPKSFRYVAGLLGRILSFRGNWVVQETRLVDRWPNRASRQPVVTAEDRVAVLRAAEGVERVITALYGVGRRRIEVVRSRVADFHRDAEPPIYDCREKGGNDEITGQFPLTASVERELAWYLPLRADWARRATADSGHLVCRWEGSTLVGVSVQYVDRKLRSAEERAKVKLWPAHSYRRGVATLLRERGADWEDVSGILGHRSPETTRLYVAPFVRRARMRSALALIETPAAEAGST